MKRRTRCSSILLLAVILLVSTGMSQPKAAAVEDGLWARDDAYQASLGQPLLIATPGLLANDSVPRGSRAIAVVAEEPRNGVLSLQPDGAFTYVADGEFSGIDHFTYRLFDGTRLSGPASVSISVPEVEAEPLASRIAPLSVDFPGPRLAAIDDFSETVDGVYLYWEKAYYQDLDLAGTAPREIPFGLNLPKNYDPEGGTRYPLVVFLHGLGSRSNWAASDPDPDLRDHALVNVPLIREPARFFASAAQKLAPYGAFVLAPQVASKSHMWVGTGPLEPYIQTDTPGNTYSEYLHLLENLLDFLLDSDNNSSLLATLGLEARDIDRDRIYMVGGSDGARGALDIVARHPEFFAASIAVAGTGPRNRLEELRRTPLWTIHGILDDSVPNVLPCEVLPVGSGSLGLLALLDPSFDNTGSSDLVYRDHPANKDDDPDPAETLIYTEFDTTYNHTEVAVGWGDLTSGILPWLFAQSRTEIRNHPPLAEDLEIETAENAPVAVTLRASDADGDSLVFRILDQPVYGTLSGTPPKLTYTPEGGFTGSDDFTYLVDDGTEESEPAFVTLTVTAIVAVVPDVAGEHVDSASDAIEAAALQVGKIRRETSDSVPPDYVIEQSPKAGSEVAPGSKVDLTIAQEPATYTLDVERTGPGSGTVGGSGTFAVGTLVTPTAAADAGSLLGGWSPAFCAGPFPLTKDTLCVATFILDEGAKADGDVAPPGARDGAVTLADALLTLRFALGTAIPAADDMVHADVAPLGADGRPEPDGVIDAADALVILRKAHGLVTW